MNVRRILATAAGGLVTAAAVAIPSPAQADDVLAGCIADGASGWAQAFGYSGATQKVKLQLGVTDNAADGHHVAVRFVSENVDGDVKKWRWRHHYEGKDTQPIWNTTATESSGIFRIGVQTGVFEKGKLLHTCGDWAF